jgi:hypothetical protein
MTNDRRADTAMKDWENEGGSTSVEEIPDRKRDLALLFGTGNRRDALRNGDKRGKHAAGPSCPFPRASAVRC